MSTNTNTPTATKVSAPVPMDVSHLSSNVSKTETVEQENDSYQYEHDQESDGDELFAVKGKGRGGFKGICFKCGIRGHKADRFWQKRKGEGCNGDLETGKGGSKGKEWPKGYWSNSRHTWDNSWHHSNWHGKTYGLEMDPWTAVEPVPLLCAVSLKSSCEDFSEAKRMSRGTRTKTSQSGSPKDFVHANKFLILAPDDNEITGERCTSMHTSRSQRQQWRYGDERFDECITTLRRKCPATNEDPVHRS